MAASLQAFIHKKRKPRVQTLSFRRLVLLNHPQGPSRRARMVVMPIVIVVVIMPMIVIVLVNDAPGYRTDRDNREDQS
jgi:hypothetical protein